MNAALAAVAAVAVAWAVVTTGWALRRHRHVPVSPDRAEPDVSSAEQVDRLASGLAGALDQLSAAVVVCDPTGEVIYRNARGDAVLGSGVDGSILRDATLGQLGGARAGAVGEREVELFGPPASTFTIRSAPWGEPVDGSWGGVALVEDLSDRRRLDQLRRDFVANISHELKTPVGATALLAETLHRELDDPDVDVIRRLVERISVEMTRLAATVDDLLELSRAEAGDELDLEVVALDDLVVDAVAKLGPVAEARGVPIDVVAKPDLRVLGDRRQLTTAVVNLVDNAIKYSPSGGLVRVVVERAETDLSISVADEGIGIPARDLARVFERFYRVDRGRSRDTGGTGLGLSIVRHIVANHGGRVEVESHEGRGSRFVITLPCSDVEEEEP